MIKKRLSAYAKKRPLLRKLRHFYIVNRNKVLRPLYRLRPIRDKTVVFDAYNGRSYACSPKALYLQMLQDERFNDYSFVWAFRKPAKYHYLVDEDTSGRTSLVKYRSPKYYRAFATAKYWIVNAMIPLQVVKRPGQVMLQCWHGTPLKRLRNDIIENTKNATNSHADFVRKNALDVERWDYLISPSTYATEKFTSAFGLKGLGKQDIVIETGYPRNDFLFAFTDGDVMRIKQELGIGDDHRKVLLYTPTWRDDQYSDTEGYIHKNEVDFDYLQRELEKEYIILFRAHYYVANNFDFEKYEGFIYNVSDVDDINDLYSISEALITDYSSTFFDYANLGRPIYFFMYDKDHYEKELRGFYLDLDELPGKIIRTEAELASALIKSGLGSNETIRRVKEFSTKYSMYDDGNAASRAIDTMLRSN